MLSPCGQDMVGFKNWKDSRFGNTQDTARKSSLKNLPVIRIFLIRGFGITPANAILFCYLKYPKQVSEKRQTKA